MSCWLAELGEWSNCGVNGFEDRLAHPTNAYSTHANDAKVSWFISGMEFMVAREAFG
jgi:hypothetical protein